MKKKSLIFLIVSSLIELSYGCTNLLVTRGASNRNNTMLYYSADSINVYGIIDSYPAKDYPEGEMLQIYSWDTGVHTGEIPQVSHTYNVIGNINEHGLSIGETTFGGLDELNTQNGIIDYGFLIWTTLQRAKTCREAITIMDNLTQTYGYYSEGESFSLIDREEVWVMEMISKGDFEKGSVWVAKRVPEGHITSHANQARITQIDFNDPDNFRYAHDAVEFARKAKLYNGTDCDFSFSDTYQPLNFVDARVCEARVWSNFKYFKDMSPWLDYVQGYNLTNRMPWSIPISEDQKLSVNDTFWVTRNHNEDTWFDNTNDVGAGPFNSPYRWRPLVWKYEGKSYLNERTVSTQQSGWNFVSVIRSDVPKEISGVTWFAMDDSCCGAKVPIFGTNTKAPESWAKPDDGTVNGNIMNFDFNHAFWITNMIANYAYSRWSEVYPEVSKFMVEQEKNGFDFEQHLYSGVLVNCDGTVDSGALKWIEEQTNDYANKMTKKYQELYGQLFARFRDGGVVHSKTVEESPGCGCDVQAEGYQADGNAWYGRIVNETGSHYEIPDSIEVNTRKKKYQ